MREFIHGIYIKSNPQFDSLSKIALSQLVLKILFQSSDGLNFRTLKNEIKNVIKADVDHKELKSVLEALKDCYSIQNDKYILIEKVKKKFEKENQHFQNLFESVLSYWFSNSTVPLIDIRNWFNKTIVKFFEIYRYDWIDEICRKGSSKRVKYVKVDDFLDESFNVISTVSKKDRLWLKEQFWKFIYSERSEDNQILWLYGTSMFSSVLLAARNYRDNVSVDLFRDSVFILDTNVLMALGLEGHELSDSLIALEKILIKYNIQPKYFNITKDEYRRAIMPKKSQIIKIFENYNEDVIKDIEDAWVLTALKRNCRNQADLERFFDTVVEINDVFYNDLPMELLENASLDDAIEKGSIDEKTRKIIKTIHFNRAKRDKKEPQLKHDVGLIKGAEYLRDNQKKCWIITADGTIKRYAIENTIRSEYPVAISLEVLLNILAVKNGNADIDPKDFAPLFANLIKYSLIPDKDIFQVADLSYLLDSNYQINELESDVVKSIAREVNQMRIKGSPDSEIGLFLMRSFQSRKYTHLSEKDNAQKDFEKEKVRREEAEGKADRLKSKLSNELKTKYKHKYLRHLFFKTGMVFIAFFIIGLFSYYISTILQSSDNKSSFLVAVSLEIIILIVVEIIFVYFKWLPKYRKDLKGLDKLVEQEINEKTEKS